jgi:hypothetical protein
MNTYTFPALIIALALIVTGWVLANKQITTINSLPVNGTIETVAE